MSTNKSFSTETSERYSRALFEVTKEFNELDKTESDIKNFQSLIKISPEVKNFLKDPTQSIDQQNKAINLLAEKFNFSKKSILVFGSEGKGMRNLVKKECDEIIQLQMQKNEDYMIDSLNVSNAASIALYEFFKS